MRLTNSSCPSSTRASFSSWPWKHWLHWFSCGKWGRARKKMEKSEYFILRLTSKKNWLIKSWITEKMIFRTDNIFKKYILFSFFVFEQYHDYMVIRYFWHFWVHVQNVHMTRFFSRIFAADIIRVEKVQNVQRGCNKAKKVNDDQKTLFLFMIPTFQLISRFPRFGLGPGLPPPGQSGPERCPPGLGRRPFGPDLVQRCPGSLTAPPHDVTPVAEIVGVLKALHAALARRLLNGWMVYRLTVQRFLWMIGIYPVLSVLFVLGFGYGHKSHNIICNLFVAAGRYQYRKCSYIYHIYLGSY